MWVALGRLAVALGWAREQGLSVEDELSYLREFDAITLARVLLACYRSGRAEGSISGVVGLLARLLKAAEEGGRKGSLIEIRILQAMAYHAQGRLPAALLPLQHALTLAEPEGYVRMFLDEGEEMRFLISDFRLLISRKGFPINEALLSRLIPYLDRLLQAFGVVQSKIENPQSKIKNLVEPLSRRELEVLHLIAQGLSNRAIGERLFLALDTVKGHNRNIYDKLQVRSRTEAVARAHELGLL